MPRHPAPPTPEVEPRLPAAGDLTVNKIIAGAGAAATAAVLGSYLGAAGTVAGAAIGSVASTMATTLYQRSLDRTRDTLVSRIRPAGGGAVDPEVTIPMQRDAEPGTGGPSPVPPPRRRWLRTAVVGAVVVFALALLVVTGLEWAKGSTLTRSEPGTSVSRVVAPEPATDEPDTEEPSAPAESAEPTTEEPTPSESAEPTDTPEPDADTSGGPATADATPSP